MQPLFTASYSPSPESRASMLLCKQQLYQRWMFASLYLFLIPIAYFLSLEVPEPFSAAGWAVRAVLLAAAVLIAPPLWKRLQRKTCLKTANRYFIQRYRMTRRLPPPVHYRFFEDRAEVSDGGKGDVFSYDMVTQAVETGRLFLLFLGPDSCYIIDRSSLGKEAQRFSEFLCERRGTPCLQMPG